MIVSDTNLLAYLVLPGDHTSASEAVLTHDPEWIAPLIVLSELRNVLTLYICHEGLSLSQAIQAFDTAEALLDNRLHAVPADKTMETAMKTGLSAYDAEYVVLARLKDLPLITFDKTLLKNVSDVAMTANDFVSRNA